MEITGTVTRNAVVNTTKTGKEVVNFTVAIGDGYRAKSGQWVDKTLFVQCSYWRSTSEAVQRILFKGATVQLFGRFETPQVWKDRDGNPRASLTFHTANIQRVRKPNAAATTAPMQDVHSTPSADTKAEKDDLPF